jgi:hypothetical protein
MKCSGDNRRGLMMDNLKTIKTTRTDLEADVIPIVKKYLDELKYGYITLVVQDGVIIQVEKNEKIRLK